MPSLTKSRAFMLFSAAAMMSAVALLGGCRKKSAAADMQMPPTAVTVATAETREVPVYLDQIGKTVSSNSVSIIPQVGGKVVSVHVEDGAYVKKGQLLFEIDPRPFRAALSSSKANLAQAKAEMIASAAQYKRVQDLMPQNVISQLEADTSTSTYEVSQAKVEAAQAELEMATLNLEYSSIVSPIDGRAGARLVDPGNIVEANKGTMLTIQSLDPIYAEFTVTENDLGTVRKHLAAMRREVGNEASLGLKALVDVPGDSATITAALGKPQPATAPATAPSTEPSGAPATTARPGTLTFLDNTVQSGTGTVRLRATVPNSDRFFWPGQFVNVRLILMNKPNAVLIPSEAQQISQQGPFVYVVAPDSTAELRPIVAGQRQGNMLVVESGVAPGEKVIVTGQMMVFPKAKVQVMDASHGAPGAAAAAH